MNPTVPNGKIIMNIGWRRFYEKIHSWTHSRKSDCLKESDVSYKMLKTHDVVTCLMY
jgi:hypothetical protein